MNSRSSVLPSLSLFCFFRDTSSARKKSNILTDGIIAYRNASRDNLLEYCSKNSAKIGSDTADNVPPKVLKISFSKRPRWSQPPADERSSPRHRFSIGRLPSGICFALLLTPLFGTRSYLPGRTTGRTVRFQLYE